VVACFFLLVFSQTAICAAQVDGGRSELPGMKKDMFDQYQNNKKKPQQAKSKAPPPCPRSDFMSPFTGITFSSSEMYVRLNGTEGKCTRLITVGGYNFTNMMNFSRTCGPAGEWKRRVAENLSTIFFQGGSESWAKHDGDIIEVITEEGTFEVNVTEAKYEEMVECWKRGCGCEQANHPTMKVLFITMGVIAISGLCYDSFKAAYKKIVGEKPPKHVLSKAGHRMVKIKPSSKYYCDACGSRGVAYQCSGDTEYHLTKKCYEEAKAKVKIAWKKWLEDHPEDRKSKKDGKDDKDDDGEDDGEGEEVSKSEAESEAKSGHTSGQEDGKSDKSGDVADENEGGADKADKKGEDEKKEE